MALQLSVVTSLVSKWSTNPFSYPNSRRVIHTRENMMAYSLNVKTHSQTSIINTLSFS
jgi:hypothetical protein